MKTKVQLSIVVATLAAGCSGGNWVDVPTLSDCSALEGKSKDPAVAATQIVRGKKDPKEAVAFFARATCSQSGKAWTGDVRCGDTGVQVKCK